MGKHAGGFHARRMMNYIGRGVTSENLLSADHHAKARRNPLGALVIVWLRNYRRRADY